MIYKLKILLLLLFSSSLIASEDISYNLGIGPIGIFEYSIPTPKLNFNVSGEPTNRFVKTPSGLQLSVDTTEGATLAHISSSMNCSTGDINLSAAIPDIKNFKDALKIFAPFAIDETTGEVDFGNFLTELITEQVFQEGTEFMINFLAFLHYQISTAANGEKPADFAIFEKEVFKSCLADKVTSAITDKGKFGLGFQAKDLSGLLMGIDISSLLGVFSCAEDAKSESDLSHKTALAAYEKSKKIVRAIFNNVLNGALNFSYSLPKECVALDKKLNTDPRKALPGAKVDLDSFKSCYSGHRSINGTTTTCAIIPEVKHVPIASSATDVKSGSVTQTEVVAQLDDTSTISAGEKTTETVFDFTTRTVLGPLDGAYDIDLLEFSPEQRMLFFDKTYNDFFNNIVESDTYVSMSTISKQISQHYIKKIITMQQLNTQTWTELSCLLNSDMCNQSVTKYEYDLLVHADGTAYFCQPQYIYIIPGTNKASCRTKVSAKPYHDQSIKKTYLATLEEDHDIVDDPSKIQKYLHKKLWLKLEPMVYDYFMALGGFIFSDDSPDLDSDNGISGADFLKKRIIQLRYAKLIKDYWSSPISSVSESSVSELEKSLASSSSETMPDKTVVLEAIDRIMNNKDDDLLSFSPLIYQPVKELQLAKLLYQLATPAYIIKLLQDKSTKLPNTKLFRIHKPSTLPKPIEPVLNYPNEDNLGDVVVSTPFVSPFMPAMFTQNSTTTPVYTFIYNDSSNSFAKLSIEELNNIAIITDKFKDFFIKRLLDSYTSMANSLVRGMIFDSKGIGTDNGEKTIEYDIKIFEYKQKQKREMLKLLLY